MSQPAEPVHNDDNLSYLARWRRLSRGAWLYLAHAALLTSSLAMFGLVFNLAIVALDVPPFLVFGQEIPVLGVLSSAGLLAAGASALPVLWLVSRYGVWWPLVVNVLLQSLSLAIFALRPTVDAMLIAAALTGVGGVLFQLSSVPFIARLSDGATRDHLFNANFAVNIGFAGLGSQIGGWLAVWFAELLAVPAGDPLAYRAVFGTASVLLLLALGPLLLVRRSSRPAQAADVQPAEPDSTAAPLAHAAAPAPDAGGLWGRIVARLPLVGRIPQPWRGLVYQPWPLVSMVLPPLLISTGAALLIPYLNLFFKQQFGVPDDLLGTIIAALAYSAGAAALVGPLISTRIGTMQTIVLVQLLSLPFLLIVGFVPLLWVAVGAAMLRQGLFNMSSPLYDAFAMERTPDTLRPTVIGAVNGAFASGYFVMPIISTWVQENYGFTPLFIVAFSLYLLASLSNYLLFVRGRVASWRLLAQGS
jgi:MFS family permease